jgi:hypothetical protein
LKDQGKTGSIPGKKTGQQKYQANNIDPNGSLVKIPGKVIVFKVLMQRKKVFKIPCLHIHQLLRDNSIVGREKQVQVDSKGCDLYKRDQADHDAEENQKVLFIIIFRKNAFYPIPQEIVFL